MPGVLRARPEQNLHARGLGNQIAVTLIIGVALILAPLMRSFLPDRFLLDDGHLRRSIEGSLVWDSDSFEVMASIYHALGLDRSPPMAALVSMGLFTAAVLIVVGWERLRDQSLIGIAAIGASFMLALAYLAQYSKEFVTLTVGLLILLLPKGRGWDVAVVGICLLYGATIRPYWAIVAVAYIGWRISLAHFRHPVWLVVVPLIMYTALTPVFEGTLGYGLQGPREWSNGERAPAFNVSTMIESPIPDATGALGVLSAMIMLGLLIVPVSLLTSGTPYHMASGVLIIGIWAVVLWPVVQGRLAARPAVVNTRSARSAALLLALLFTQSLFEPDYGSYLKHVTPLLPLALALLPAASRMPGVAREPLIGPRPAHPYSSDLAGVVPLHDPEPALASGRRRSS